MVDFKNVTTWVFSFAGSRENMAAACYAFIYSFGVHPANFIFLLEEYHYWCLQSAH